MSKWSYILWYCELELQHTGLRSGLPWWFRRWRICWQCKRLGFDLWVRKICWRREWQPTCLENPTDRGAWWVTVHGVSKSWKGATIHPVTSGMESREQDFTRTGGNLGDNRYVHCLGYNDGFMVAYIYVCVCFLKMIKLCILNICSLLCQLYLNKAVKIC